MRWQGDLGIITSRAISFDDQNIIELWGRSRQGDSILLRVHGMEPWLEITPLGRWDGELEAQQIKAERLAEGNDIIRVEGPVEKWTDLGFKPVWKVFVPRPFNIPKIRAELSRKWLVLSGDIPFANRVFLDGNLSIHASVEGNITSLDRSSEIVVNVEESDFSFCEPFPVPWVILSFDLETSIATGRILCGAAVVEFRGEDKRERFIFKGKEYEIMKDLTALIRRVNPDIITGYNIDNFDLPKLNERLEELSSPRHLEAHAELFGWGRVLVTEEELKRRRNGLLPRRGNTRAWSIGGRCVMDCWWQARQTLRPERETLSFVSKLLFPNDLEKHKIGIDASKMDDEWSLRPEEVIEYCLRDAEIPLDILAQIQAVRRCEAIASVAGVPLETAANGSTSQRLDALVIRAADRAGIAVPLTGSAEKKEGQIQGGYVHDVEAGLHPWISVLDFKSMYPSIMISNNICYTTRVEEGSTDQPENDEKLFISPTGVRFRHPEKRRGLVPQLLEDLMEKRDLHKTAFKEAKDENTRRFHDQMQYAVKIMMNTFYGVFASGFYRFTHRDLGTSITAWARHNIKKIIQRLENEGNKVVYSDTDSIFVSSPLFAGKDALQSMIEFGHNIAERFSEDGAILEFEKGLSAFFSHGAKKRYVGQVVWPNEELIIRGYETQRTDSFTYLTEGMKKLFEYILTGSTESAITLSLEQIKAVKSGKVDPRLLIISKSCKGRFDKKNKQWVFHEDYTNPESMAQVSVAKEIISRGLPFTPGMKVSYVVENAKKRPMKVRAWFEDEAKTYLYDVQFYAERLATAFGRVTEAFGWDAKELYSGNRQTTLFSF